MNNRYNTACRQILTIVRHRFCGFNITVIIFHSDNGVGTPPRATNLKALTVLNNRRACNGSSIVCFRGGLFYLTLRHSLVAFTRNLHSRILCLHVITGLGGGSIRSLARIFKSGCGGCYAGCKQSPRKRYHGTVAGGVMCVLCHRYVPFRV